MNTTRKNWKKHKARTAQFRRQTNEQMALNRSRDRAASLRRAVNTGLVTSLGELLAMAESQESRELRGSVSHEALKLALEIRNKGAV
ncbi:hypothetical protein [Oceanimonas smirnovii]|uniref:hypothetical protein n=1 Tax=Oceanimonas smirnovii TaxID=264574 RepID=UPI003FD58516